MYKFPSRPYLNIGNIVQQETQYIELNGLKM